MRYQIFQTTGHGTKKHSPVIYTDRTKAEKRLAIVIQWYSPTYKFFLKEV